MTSMISMTMTSEYSKSMGKTLIGLTVGLILGQAKGIILELVSELKKPSGSLSLVSETRVPGPKLSVLSFKETPHIGASSGRT